MTRMQTSPEAAPRAQPALRITVDHSVTHFPETSENRNFEEIGTAMSEAAERQLARGQGRGNQLLRATAMTCVAAINQVGKMSSAGIQSTLDRAAAQQGAFAAMSLEECLDFMILLARIIKEKETEADSQQHGQAG